MHDIFVKLTFSAFFTCHLSIISHITCILAATWIGLFFHLKACRGSFQLMSTLRRSVLGRREDFSPWDDDMSVLLAFCDLKHIKKWSCMINGFLWLFSDYTTFINLRNTLQIERFSNIFIFKILINFDEYLKYCWIK